MILLLTALLVSADPEQSGSASATAPISIALRLPVGRDAVYRLRVDRTVSAADGQSTFESKFEYGLRHRVVKRTNAGATVQITVESLKFTATGSAKHAHIDTAAPVQENESAESIGLRQAVGKSFRIELDHDGTIANIEGASALVGKAPAGSPVQEMLGESQLRNLLRVQFDWMPDRAVAVGQSWRRKETAAIGPIALLRENTVTLRRASAEQLEITSKIIVADAPMAKQPKPEKPAYQVAAKRPGSARIVFDAERGVLETLTAEISLDLRANETPADQTSPSTPQVHRLNAKTEVQLISLDGQRVNSQ